MPRVAWQVYAASRGLIYAATELALFAREFNNTALIDPGKPWQNGTTESFNGKFRDECLSMEWFRNRIEARIVVEDWRQHYNEVRPHSSLGYLTPMEWARQLKKGLSTEARFQMPVV